jgi:hypothetical protein
MSATDSLPETASEPTDAQLVVREAAAKLLFLHWQRDAKESARLTWGGATPHLRGVFLAQATALAPLLGG